MNPELKNSLSACVCCSHRKKKSHGTSYGILPGKRLNLLRVVMTKSEFPGFINGMSHSSEPHCLSPTGYQPATAGQSGKA